MRRSRFQAGALILAAALLSGCYESESRVTQRVERSWDASELELLDLETLNGRVEVRSGGNEIVVRAEVRSSLDGQREVIRFSSDDGVLRVREKWPRRNVGLFPFRHGGGGSVRYEIEVPERLALELGTTNGRIGTFGVRGDQSISSVNGRIEIDTPGASIDAGTVNGRIEARFRESFPGARLKTVNGSVKVYVPAGTRVAADVDQVNGSFNSRLPVIVNARDATAGAPLRVSTVNGSVTLDEIGEDPVSADVVTPNEL